MDVGNNSLRAKGSSPYGRREKSPPLGVQCPLRSECSVPSARGAVVHPARGAVVHPARGAVVHPARGAVVHPARGAVVHLARGAVVHLARSAVYPPLGVWCTLRSE